MDAFTLDILVGYLYFYPDHDKHKFNFINLYHNKCYIYYFYLVKNYFYLNTSERFYE